MKGSIYKRGKTWTYRVDIGRDPFTNKRNQISKGGFRTKKECQDALAKILTEYNEGSYVNESEVTLKDFADKWLEIYERTGNIKPSTIKTRKTQKNRIMKYFKNIKLKDITATMYQDFLLDMRDKYAKETIQGTHATACMIFEKAVELKYIKENPTERAIIPTKMLSVEELENQDALPKYFEKEELIEFLEACKGLEEHPQAYIMFLLLSYTGMRVGELLALKWQDIDLENNTIKIYKTMFHNTGIEGYELLTAKTKTSVREIYIDDLLVSELKKHKAWQNKLRLKIPSWHDDFIVTKITFPGYPMTIKEVGLIMDKALRGKKLPKITPHGLRHTHTSLLAQAGVGLEEIMERLGHRNASVTRNIYLHVTKKMKKEASNKFLELMNN